MMPVPPYCRAARSLGGGQRNGRAWVESRYDINVIGDRLWSIYWEPIDPHDAPTASQAAPRRVRRYSGA